MELPSIRLSLWFLIFGGSHLFISLDMGKSCGAGFTGRNLAQQMRCSCPTSHLIQNEDLIAGASRSTECASLLHLACPSSSTYKYLASGTCSQLNPIACKLIARHPKSRWKIITIQILQAIHQFRARFIVYPSTTACFLVIHHSSSANRWPPSDSNCMVAVLHIAQHLDSSEPHYPPVECLVEPSIPKQSVQWLASWILRVEHSENLNPLELLLTFASFSVASHTLPKNVHSWLPGPGNPWPSQSVPARPSTKPRSGPCHFPGSSWWPRGATESHKAPDTRTQWSRGHWQEPPVFHGKIMENLWSLMGKSMKIHGFRRFRCRFFLRIHWITHSFGGSLHFAGEKQPPLFGA